MKISVIIPTYNEENVILDCLKSLDKQTHKDFEVIVVDDGSNDKTLFNIKDIKFKNFRIIILNQDHQGPGIARNFGAKKAKGDILVFVDADMTFNKDFLKNLVKPIENETAKGTFSKEEYVSNWENPWARCWNINEGWVEKRRHPENYPDTQKVFRAILKSEFEKVGGFDRGGYTDDWTLSQKLGYDAIAAPNAKFYHKNPDNLHEIYSHAKWVAKREYKFGFFGYLVAFIRYSLPVSKLIGIYKAIKFKNARFFVFKIIYNFGCFVGLFEYVLSGKSSK